MEGSSRSSCARRLRFAGDAKRRASLDRHLAAQRSSAACFVNPVDLHRWSTMPLGGVTDGPWEQSGEARHECGATPDARLSHQTRHMPLDRSVRETEIRRNLVVGGTQGEAAQDLHLAHGERARRGGVGR
jgi:hypothetical protein